MYLTYGFPFFVSNSFNSTIIQLINTMQNTNLCLPLVIKYVALSLSATHLSHPLPSIHPLPLFLPSLHQLPPPRQVIKKRPSDIQEEKEKTLSLFVAALIYFVH